MIQFIQMDVCSTHPDQTVQLYCSEPKCKQQAICAMCLVETHRQHKVELIKPEVEKMVEEVAKHTQEQHNIVLEKLQRISSLKDKISGNKAQMNKQISERVTEYIDVICQVESLLKKTLDERSDEELAKISAEEERLQIQQAQLEALVFARGSRFSDVMREGPRLLESLRHMGTGTPWEFTCHVPVLKAAPFPPTLYLGQDPSLTCIGAVQQSVRSEK